MRPRASDSDSAVLAEPAADPRSAHTSRDATILVVGERALDPGHLDVALTDVGYRVLTAGSCARGLELARTCSPDLIICAVLVADMDGFDFVQQLRDIEGTRDTRVVFWTATFAEPDIRDLALACGVTDILCEPCAPEDLHRTVRSALDAHGTQQLPLAGEDYQTHLRVLNSTLAAKVEALERSERKTAETMTLLQVFGQHVPVGFGLLDTDGRHIHVNNALAAITGLARDAHPGRLIAEVVPALWRQIRPLFDSVVATGAPVVNAEVNGWTPADTELHHWLVSLYPVRLDDETVGIGALVSDVTDRRRGETLRSAIMDTMVEGVLVSDPDGAITYANAAAAAIAGWRPRELHGTPLEAIVRDVESTETGAGARSRPGACDVSPLCEDRAGASRKDGVVLRSDGTVVPVSYSCAPLCAGQHVTGCVTVFRDVTEERAEQLRVQAELEAVGWLGRIRDALAEDRFVLYAQPVVPLRGDPGGFELLLRMRSPTGEIIEPEAFLPVAERFGIITEVDRWVIAHAMRLAGPERDIGINLSARSLGDPGLLEFIVRQFESAGVDPSCVTFEITETALMENLDAGQRLAEGLDALGSGVALDDFGTGFGSFTYLKRLPLRYLKIDAEFVTDLTEHPANRHLVKATVGLARDFGYKTVAEGVEDAATLEILRELGVDFAQGFHLGRPAPTAR